MNTKKGLNNHFLHSEMVGFTVRPILAGTVPIFRPRPGIRPD